MGRRPRRPTLFPYTTLFRSVKIRATAKGRILAVDIDETLLAPSEKSMVEDLIAAARSEEHTSELQSQFHLVCRLLLEKKNRRRCTPRRRSRSRPCATRAREA